MKKTFYFTLRVSKLINIIIYNLDNNIKNDDYKEIKKIDNYNIFISLNIYNITNYVNELIIIIKEY